MSNHEDLIAQFIEISGREENIARFYLSSSNWSLEDALSNFLANHGEDDITTETTTGANALVLENQASGVRVSKTDEEFKRNAKPKFATLNDMPENTPNDDEGQAFYAGGSERSGQQVLGPPKRKNFREQLTDMFRSAHEHTTSEAAPSTSAGVSWGQGVRLGMTDDDHAVVTPSSGNTDGTSEKKPVVVLKLWSQGFSIDNGELRLYDDPENKNFLETVMRGEIPHELLEMGWMVNVDVEDHRHEEYKKVTIPKTFKGSGHTLGSPAPEVATAQPKEEYSTADNAAKNEKNAREQLNLSFADPVTTLQIRLIDGSRLSAQFNLTHTVADIQQYIQNARPEYEDVNFFLVLSFPTRELKNESATIAEAGLKNAVVMQRLK